MGKERLIAPLLVVLLCGCGAAAAFFYRDGWIVEITTQGKVTEWRLDIRDLDDDTWSSEAAGLEALAVGDVKANEYVQKIWPNLSEEQKIEALHILLDPEIPQPLTFDEANDLIHFLATDHTILKHLQDNFQRVQAQSPYTTEATYTLAYTFEDPTLSEAPHTKAMITFLVDGTSRVQYFVAGGNIPGSARSVVYTNAFDQQVNSDEILKGYEEAIQVIRQHSTVDDKPQSTVLSGSMRTKGEGVVAINQPVILELAGAGVPIEIPAGNYELETEHWSSTLQVADSNTIAVTLEHTSGQGVGPMGISGFGLEIRPKLATNPQGQIEVVGEYRNVVVYYGSRQDMMPGTPYPVEPGSVAEQTILDLVEAE